MRKAFASALVISSCLMLLACSYSVDFVVVNESDRTIEIEYKILTKNVYTAPSEEGRLSPNLIPAKVSLLTWERPVRRDDWQPVAPGEYVFDAHTGTVKFRLPPRQALRILTASDGLFFRDGYKHFPITKLEIKGESGRISFEGAQLFKQFLEHTYSNRFIAYKQLPVSETERSVDTQE